MSVYLIEAMDTQFYRSTLPFDAGADGYTETLNFPWPRTLYGAIRAVGFSDCGIQMGESAPVPDQTHNWGGWNKTGNAMLKGPLIFQKRENMGGTVSDILLPMPADLVLDKEGETLFRCSPDESIKLEAFSDCVDYPGVCRIKIADSTQKKCKNAENFLFLWNANIPIGTALKNYLTHNLHGDVRHKVVKIEDTCASEYRIGIKRSISTHTSEEGFLFSSRHYRLKSKPLERTFGYWFQIDSEDGSSITLPDDRFIKMGGESRIMSISQVLDGDNLDSRWASVFKTEIIKKIADNGGRFKLYLITPGIFEKGRCHPFTMNTNKIMIQEKERTAQLVGISLNGHALVGGWDIVKRKPKPLDTAVPSGSVYFFRDENWPDSEDARQKAAELWFDHFNFKSLCTTDNAKEGFGITLIGGWHV